MYRIFSSLPDADGFSLFCSLIGLLLCIVYSASHSASGRELFVSPDGNQNATGTRDDPLNTLRTAVGRAIDGDIIVLFPGTYNNFRDVEVYDFRELHFRALDPTNRSVF